MSAKRDESDFLERWSARKRGAGTGAPDPDPSPSRGSDASPSSGSVDGGAPRVPAPESAAAVPGRDAGDEWATAPDAGPDAGPDTGPEGGSGADDPSEPPPLTDADMPPVESLDATSDLSGFFSRGVSAALRRAALRHVFSQPSYNVRDGLNDYDGDYTAFEPLGDTVTSDMKFHAARHERERLRREAEAEADGRLEVSSADGAEAGGEEVDESAGERDPSAAEGDADAVESEAGAERGADGNDERTPRADTSRDELASNGTAGQPLNGRPPDGAGTDEDEDRDGDGDRDRGGEGAGHG